MNCIYFIHIHTHTQNKECPQHLIDYKVFWRETKKVKIRCNAYFIVFFSSSSLSQGSKTIVLDIYSTNSIAVFVGFFFQFSILSFVISIWWCLRRVYFLWWICGGITLLKLMNIMLAHFKSYPSRLSLSHVVLTALCIFHVQNFHIGMFKSWRCSSAQHPNNDDDDIETKNKPLHLVLT